MAFPFGFDSRLRQQLLLAIGTSGWLTAAAIGCTSKHPPLEQSAGRGGAMSAAGRNSMPESGAGSGVRAGSGGVGTRAGSGGVGLSAGSGGARTSAGSGGAGTSAGMGGSMTSAGAGAAGTMGPVTCETGTPQSECYSPATLKQKATFGCGQIPISPTPTDEQIAAKFLPNGCLQRASTCNGCCNPAASDGIPQGDGSCCYTFCAGACCGRPFVVDDAPRLAELEPRSDWTGTYTRSNEAESWTARIAAEWLEDARMEHASIASFARFTLDLLAYGAPAELVEAAQRAGLDECEHARLCFGLAARFGAGSQGPAQLSAAGATVAPSLWHAAVAAFREGCVSETLAALQAGEAWERARDPEVKRALERIAADEARHAELAWRFVSWSASWLGGDFTAELERQLSNLRAVPAPASSERETDAVASALRDAGRLTSSDKQRLDHVGVHEVIAPCLAALIEAQRSEAA